MFSLFVCSRGPNCILAAVRELRNHPLVPRPKGHDRELSGICPQFQGRGKEGGHASK